MLTSGTGPGIKPEGAGLGASCRAKRDKKITRGEREGGREGGRGADWFECTKMLFEQSCKTKKMKKKKKIKKHFV